MIKPTILALIIAEYTFNKFIYMRVFSILVSINTHLLLKGQFMYTCTGYRFIQFYSCCDEIMCYCLCEENLCVTFHTRDDSSNNTCFNLRKIVISKIFFVLKHNNIRPKNKKQKQFSQFFDKKILQKRIPPRVA